MTNTSKNIPEAIKMVRLLMIDYNIETRESVLLATCSDSMRVHTSNVRCLSCRLDTPQLK